MTLKKQPKVVTRLIEAYEVAKDYHDYNAMANIALEIEAVQRVKN